MSQGTQHGDPVAVEASPGVGQPFTVEVRVRLQAVALPEADGRYSIVVPALPGCISEAESVEEIQGNAVEAAEGWLAVSYDQNKDEDILVMRGES